MRGLWDEKNWRLEGAHIVMPNGWRVALRDIRQWRADMIEGAADLPGRWAGWRIRRNILIPAGMTMQDGGFTTEYLRASLQWSRPQRHSRRQLDLF